MQIHLKTSNIYTISKKNLHIMKLPPLKALYSFIAVVETGGMTQAAEQLNVSHSAVSQAIKSLESQIGQPLFKRIGRHVVLNTAGRQYYKQVAPAIEQIVNATHQLIANQSSHRLTLNMINSLTMHWWIPRVHQFNEYAPQLDLRISTLAGTFVMEAEGVDAAIIHGTSEEWPDYYCELLSEDELIMVCSPELYAITSDPTELLRRFPAITTDNDRRKFDWQVWCCAFDVALPRIARNLSFTSSIQAVQAAIRKQGIFVTHRQFVKDDVKQGLLKEVGTPVQNPHQQFYFVCPPNKLKNEHILTVRNWLKSEFGSQESVKT